jgi:hypothetical protein
MLAEFDFELLRLRYVKAAAARIPAFRPDGRGTAELQAVITGATNVRDSYMDGGAALSLSRGQLRQAAVDGHETAMGVYPAMKSRYRKDPASLEVIRSLPVNDRTRGATIERMQQISAVWARLPDVGTPPASFVAWQGMAKTNFDALMFALTTGEAARPAEEKLFGFLQGQLHETQTQISDLVTAALVQGRAQFVRGSSREVIDSIPTEAAAKKPAEAVISVAISPEAGTVHLEFDAAHGTSFDVRQRRAGEATWTTVVEHGLENSYDATDLPPGVYEFGVVAQNSLGEGEQSAVATVTVA